MCPGFMRIFFFLPRNGMANILTQKLSPFQHNDFVPPLQLRVFTPTTYTAYKEKKRSNKAAAARRQDKTIPSRPTTVIRGADDSVQHEKQDDDDDDNDDNGLLTYSNDNTRGLDTYLDTEQHRAPYFAAPFSPSAIDASPLSLPHNLSTPTSPNCSLSRGVSKCKRRARRIVWTNTMDHDLIHLRQIAQLSWTSIQSTYFSAMSTGALQQRYRKLRSQTATVLSSASNETLDPQLRQSTPEQRPRGRGLQHYAIYERTGNQASRFGRPLVKPLKYWVGERYNWKDGDVDGVFAM